MTGRLPAPSLIEGKVLEVLRHPRYRGEYVPLWRIVDAVALPLTPAAIRRSLERLETEGRVEHRRVGADQAEWRPTA